MAELPLTPAVRQTWQTLIRYPWGTAEKINLRKGDLKFLEALLYNYVNQCSEGQMKTPDLLKTGLPAAAVKSPKERLSDSFFASPETGRALPFGDFLQKMTARDR